MGRVMRVAVVAQAEWATRLRSYIHDHMQAMTVEALLDRSQLGPGRRFDVMVVDEATRVVSAADVSKAVAAGTIVVGLFDVRHPAGESYLDRLGASRIYRSDMDTATLAAAIAAIGPVQVEEPVVRPEPSGPAGAGGMLTAVSAANGGSGLTEALVAMANRWARRRRVVMVEANPMAAGMAARLRRPGDWGLAWVLGLVPQGRPVLPAGLSPKVWPNGRGLGDLGRGLGDFDLICQSAQPGGPPVMSPAHLDTLVDEVLAAYDHVVVEVGALVMDASPALDRFAAGRQILMRADQVVVFARAEPESVLDLANWRAAAVTLGVRAPCHAVFGRARGGFESSHLVHDLEELTNSPTGRFATVTAVPEDPKVAKGRWNQELVRPGRWLSAVERLADQLAEPASLAGEPALPVVDLTAAAVRRRPEVKVSEAWS